MLNRIDALLEGLNENQKRAATAMNGKYLVLASAGSGKTRVLTHRIAYLIELGVQPWEIVGISFTKKASNEIKERVAKLIGEKALDVNMGTFHSLCMRILIRHQEALGMSNMTILDDTEAKKIISDIAVTFGYMSEDAVYEIKNSIDRWGNEGWTAEQVKQQGNNPEDIVNIYEEYSSFKRSVGYVDFNDILSLTHELFRFRPDILQQYSSKYKYLIVDESQDLNNIQFKLVQQLSSHHQNFMLIGDDLQCQPAGTKVLMIDGTEKNIEDIRKGDRVVSYMMGDARKFSSTSKNSKRSWNARGYEVTGTSSHFSEKIVTIETESGKKTSYSNNHIMYARFKNDKNRWITYIMGNEKGQYRVGKTTLFTSGKHVYSGIRNRMHQEKCTHAWILGVFENKQDAWFAEQIAAVQFGIPQITFQTAKVDYTKEFVDKLFLSIPNIKERLENVLNHFDRDVNYPIATTSEWRGVQSRHLSQTSLFPVEAINIMPDSMEVLEYDENDRKGKYSTIKKVSLSKEKTMVYGLTIEKYHNYVADGILTHNCIYSFRGSDVGHIMNIRQFDAQVQTILLEQNYRSSQSIVKASNALIANNVNQMEKISYTENGEGSPVFIYDSIDETKEADFVVSVIEGLVKNKGMQYDDFAVLYRANYLSRNIELAFSSVGIPYEIVGGSEFYERDEIKTLVCYLRALDNEMDDLAHERILNKPKRGIGATTVNRISMYAAENNVSFFKALQHIEDIPKINKPTKGRILEFVDLLNQAKEMLRKPDATVLGLLKYMMIQTDFMAQYDVYKTEDLTRIQNIEELWNVAAQFDNKPKEELAENQTIVTQFLTETALYVQDDDPDARARVSLTTVHSSKGLEFKCVFVIGLQAGVFPSYLSTQQDDLEEERRLFYVAMTRAKEMLFLSFNRYKYNGGQKQEVQPSRFLKEIPEEYTRYLGQKNW